MDWVNRMKIGESGRNSVLRESEKGSAAKHLWPSLFLPTSSTSNLKLDYQTPKYTHAFTSYVLAEKKKSLNFCLLFSITTRYEISYFSYHESVSGVTCSGDLRARIGATILEHPLTDSLERHMNGKPA
jgi:hypothetical protein